MLIMKVSWGTLLWILLITEFSFFLYILEEYSLWSHADWLRCSSIKNGRERAHQNHLLTLSIDTVKGTQAPMQVLRPRLLPSQERWADRSPELE